MFQKNGEIYNKESFDKYVKENMFQFNYIYDYTILVGNSKKEDIGWSCAIKTFQMCLCFVLNKWGINSEVLFNTIYKEQGDLSVHKFITNYKKNNDWTPGMFFGIYEVISIFKQISKNKPNINVDIHITSDNIIDISKLNLHKPNILFFSTCLGKNIVDTHYHELIKICYSCPFFNGLIGGVEKSSYYFFGRHTYIDNLLYLDPHFANKYLDKKNLSDLRATHYLTTPISTISSTMTFCFSYKNKEEFLILKKFLEKQTIFNILHKLYYDESDITSIDDWSLC